MTDTCRARHSRRLEALKTERSIYESHWSNLDKFIAPGRYRLNHQQDRKFFAGRYKEIVDETSLLAFRIMRSGMMSGQTSPSRPWFRMTTMDPDLREVESVKEYLYQCETRMRQMLQSSNVYNVLHNSYGDEGQFGQSASILVDDDLDTVRALPLVTGQFWLAQNHRHRVDTLYRLCPMTVEQVVGRFVVMPGGDMDWSRVSNTVKNLWDNSSYDEWVRIYHAVEPRRDRDQTKADKRNKTFLSNYWEDAGVRDTMLEESGFDMNPIIAPRWETVANDVYASTAQ